MDRYVNVGKIYCEECDFKDNCENVVCDLHTDEELVFSLKDIEFKICDEMDDSNFRNRVEAKCYNVNDDFVRGFKAGMLHVLSVLGD